MINLTVKNFSAIKDASIAVGRITVLIGPQASGKSVLCKLNYFFLELLDDQVRFITDKRSLDYFKDYIKEKFCEWFPISAWGEKKFTIGFKAGDYTISISRVGTRKTFRLSISEEFSSEYNTALQKFQDGKKIEDPTEYEFEREFHIRRWFDSSRVRLLGKDNVVFQIFIPAGRSFFTNIGKAVAAFEQGRFLDPLTVKFGRIFTSYKSRRYIRNKTTENSQLIDDITNLLGGKHIEDGDKEYVLLHDGRQIPLSALSSGQQELLPLISVLPTLFNRVAANTASNRLNRLVYIEEPEAHLFPMAQSQLVEILAKTVRISGNSLDMLITTHSPYVLAKLNNLIKAGQIARKSNINKDALAKIVSENGWLPKNFVEAYSIKDGLVEKIIDSEGLISADYLDSVSIEISEEFESLLDLEFSKS